MIRVRTKLSVDARMLKTCFGKLHDMCYFISSQTFHSSSFNLVSTKYDLKSQYIKLTQL